MKKVLFILAELDDEDVDWLVEVGDSQRVPAGTVLIHEGKAVDTLYILLEGTLVVSISAMAGREIARLSSGEVVGEMSFVDARPPSATVQTLEESLVLAIPRSQLAEKLKQDVGFGSRFYRALAILLSYRLRGTVKQLGEDKDKPSGQQDAADLVGSTSVAIAEVRFNDLLQRLKSQGN